MGASLTMIDRHYGHLAVMAVSMRLRFSTRLRLPDPQPPRGRCVDAATSSRNGR
jgi:hypothetical protein